MTPTMELRFVERTVSVPLPNDEDVWTFKTLRILQQKWRDDNLMMKTNGSFDFDYEWRDVEVVKEGEA